MRSASALTCVDVVASAVNLGAASAPATKAKTRAKASSFMFRVLD